MPIYDYICTNCNLEFDIKLKSIKDYDSNFKPTCPNCSRSFSTERTYKNTSFQLKGNCWAKDHYGKNLEKSK